MRKAIIEKYMEEVWNQKNLDYIEKVFSDHPTIHSPFGDFNSAQAMRETAQKWLIAMPDLKLTLLNVIEENNLIVAHWRAEGTHQHELKGVPAKGNPLVYQGVSMYRLVNDKITEYWAFVDSWTLQKQMNASSN